MEQNNADLRSSGVRFQTCSPAVSVRIMVSVCSRLGQGTRQCARRGAPYAAARPKQRAAVLDPELCTMALTL